MSRTDKLSQITKKIIRFIEIDLNYLRVKQNFTTKLVNVINTDLAIVLNLIFRAKKYSPVTINGFKIYYDTPFATKLFLDTVYDFYFETHKLRIFSERPVIVDVGANIGQFLFAVKTFLPKSNIYCFEPDEKIYKILKKNSSNFKFVSTFCNALSSRNMQTTFYKSNEYSVWSSLIAPAEKDQFTQDIVDVRRGDDVLLKLKKIDLLKIDVEGAELDALTGLKETLKKSKYLLIEASLDRESTDGGSSKLFKFIFDNGFVLDSVGRIYASGKGGIQGAADFLFKNKNFL